MVSIISGSALQDAAIEAIGTNIYVELLDTNYTNQTFVIDDDSYLCLSTGDYVSLNSTNGNFGITDNKEDAVSGWYIESNLLFLNKEENFLAVEENSLSYVLYMAEAKNKTGETIKIMCFTSSGGYTEFIPSNMNTTQSCTSIPPHGAAKNISTTTEHNYSISTSVSLYSKQTKSNTQLKNDAFCRSNKLSLVALLAIFI